METAHMILVQENHIVVSGGLTKFMSRVFFNSISLNFMKESFSEV